MSISTTLQLPLTNTSSSDDTVGDLKKLIAAQTGTKWDRIVLKKWYVGSAPVGVPTQGICGDLISFDLQIS